MKAKTPSVPSVLRTLDILEAISRSKAGLTLLEIVQDLNFPRSSVHCLVVTLERRGYLHKNGRSARYKLGPMTRELANFAFAGIALRDQVAPVLFTLMQATGLAVHLGILECNEVVLAHKLEPSSGPRLATWVGKRMEMHCTGVGKAFLAYFSESDLQRHISEHGLPRHNEHTISSVSRLRADLQSIRSLGYALDDEEDELGYRCIGCPVFDAEGQVIAAISIVGTTGQIRPDKLAGLVQKSVDAAAKIAQLASAAPRSWNAHTAAQPGLAVATA
jgi:DNA-binding IclR family transcriptional regulator